MAGRYEPTWESLLRYQVPSWFADAKFGIFVHWGVYSVPAYGESGEWYPRFMYMDGRDEYRHHRKTWGAHKDFGYKDFIPRFRAERFAPSEWMALFRRAGARYVVPTAEHHDVAACASRTLAGPAKAASGPDRAASGPAIEPPPVRLEPPPACPKHR